MIKPLFGRVLVKRETLQSKTSLIIPDTAEDRNAPERGEVLATGPTCDESIEVGQRVIFGRYAGTWIQDGDDRLYVLQDEDILGVEHAA